MAAKPNNNTTTLQIAVTLSQGAVNFLKQNSKDGDYAATLAGWAAYWCDNQARGGILLEPVDHDYLSELNEGKRFRDSRALVRAVEKGLKRDEGQFSFRIGLDPVWVAPLQEIADTGGLTMEETVSGIINQCVTNGWLWDLSPTNGRNIPFTEVMLKETAELCGKKGIDSTDVAGLIAEDRFLPISRETKAKGKEIIGKLDFSGADLDAVFAEIETLRAQVAQLAKQGLVAA